MRRRDILLLLGGAAVEWPLMAWAQKGEMPIIGYLSSRLAVLILVISLRRSIRV